MTREESWGRVLEKLEQLERRCSKKEEDIDKLLEFKNRLVGYAMAIGAISSIVTSIFAKKLGL